MRIHFVQHVSFEYPGSIVKWALTNTHTITFTKIFEHTMFPQTSAFDMLVVMGGPMGVYEEHAYPWIAQEKQFISDSIAAGKRVLGICLGAQLIAAVLDAKVYPHTLKEIGWWPIYKVTDHPVIASLPTHFFTFHLHGDTYDLPAGATPLFRSEGCAQQGFIINKVAGIQFHPEIENDLLENMIEHEKETFIPFDFVQSETTVRKLAEDYMPQQEKFLSSFLQNFLRNDS